MNADFSCILDACVLANSYIGDLALRLAETPRLYLPKWSERLLDEMQRTHRKLNWPEPLVEYTRKCMESEFAEAMVTDYEEFEKLESLAFVDSKDRHVAAAAIQANASVIVTFNLKHFPSESLARFDIEARHPDLFLTDLNDIDAKLVLDRLHRMAAQRGKSVEDVALRIAEFAPRFVHGLAAPLDWDLNRGGGDQYDV